MQIDKLTKVLLLAIVILLSIIIVRWAPESYAAKKVEYKVTKLPSTHYSKFVELERELNKHGADGWEIVYYDDSGSTILIRR